MTEKRKDAPEVVRPKSAGAGKPGATPGMVCVECGFFHPEVNLAWCRACGGKVTLGSANDTGNAVKADSERRGIK